MDWLYDDRTDCWSFLTTVTVREYLKLVRKAHASRGAISGQRDVLKTTTAKRIRDRMVADIKQSAVLPPVVLGAVIDDPIFDKLPLSDSASANDFLDDETAKDIAIIDGMQRTQALLEAVRDDSAVLEFPIRVEFWLSRSVRSMVYRMLVLNTGQVPWTLARQLSVVYAPLLAELREKVPEIDRVFSPEKPGRRVDAAQYSSDALVELYIAFSLRKTNVDAKEALSEEFSRLDFVENLSDLAFQEQFYSTLTLLVRLDRAFSRYEGDALGRYGKGRNVFDGQPARIGFIVAIAQHTLGRPGMDREPTDRKKRMAELITNASRLILTLNELGSRELGAFLRLDVLEETLDKRVGQVGRYERAVFFEAFKVLVEENFELPNMEPCWRAN
jgi:hypothetical protein